MKQSKVKTVVSAKPYTGQHGTTIYHNLIMENGDKINIGKKNQLNGGEELIYELTGQDDGQQEYKKAKAVKPENNFQKPFTNESNPSRGNEIALQTFIKASAEFHAQRTHSTWDIVLIDAKKALDYFNANK